MVIYYYFDFINISICLSKKKMLVLKHYSIDERTLAIVIVNTRKRKGEVELRRKDVGVRGKLQ